MEVLREFRVQLILFFDELIESFPEEGDLVIARLFISTQVPILEIMNDFNHHINKEDQRLRKMIEERREDFFLSNTLFPSVKKNLYNFKKLWRSGNLEKDEKEVIWKWVDTFVYLGDKYIREVAGK